MSIKNLSEDERPRERLIRYGAESLKPSELLAILVGSGNTDETAVQLMQRVLQDHDGKVGNLAMESLTSLEKYKGIGEAKAVTIKAACQLGRVMQAEGVTVRKVIRSAKDVSDLMSPKLCDKNHEECWAVYLNTAMQMLTYEQISKGGISESSVDIRIVLYNAISVHATGIILVHNHPTGNLVPSTPDDRLTQKLKQASAILNIRLLDHIIVSGNRYYSYNEHSRL